MGGRQVPGAPKAVGLGAQKAGSRGARREAHVLHPRAPEMGPGSLSPSRDQLRGQRAGPRPRGPEEKGSLTQQAGQDPHVCRTRGRDGARGGGSSEGSAAATGGRDGDDGDDGDAPAQAPWTREEQAGAGCFARSKRGCRGGSRGQEGAGRGLAAAAAWGGGGLRGGRAGVCPAANTHTDASSPGGRAGAETLRGRTEGRGARGGRVGRAPTHLPALPSGQGSVGGPWRRGRRLGSQGLLGSGVTVQQQEGSQPDSRKDFLGRERGLRNPLHSAGWSWMQGPISGEAVGPLCPPPLPGKQGGGWQTEKGGRGGGCTHTRGRRREAENLGNGEGESAGWRGAGAVSSSPPRLPGPHPRRRLMSTPRREEPDRGGRGDSLEKASEREQLQALLTTGRKKPDGSAALAPTFPGGGRWAALCPPPPPPPRGLSRRRLRSAPGSRLTPFKHRHQTPPHLQGPRP